MVITMESGFIDRGICPPQCALQTVLSDGGLKVSPALEGKGSLPATWVSLSTIINIRLISNLNL